MGPDGLAAIPALKPLYDALPVTLRDPAAGPPTSSDILRLPLRSFTIGIGNPLQPGPYHHDQASKPDLVRFYFEDGWTIRPGLTFSYGLAYLKRTKIYNQDLERPAYLAPLLGGDLRPPYRGTTNLGPMAGLAWSLRKNGDTVLRAGVGLYHDDWISSGPTWNGVRLVRQVTGESSVDGSVTGLSFLSTPTAFEGRDLLPLLPGIRSMLTQKLGDGTNSAVTGIEAIKQGDRIFDANHTTPSAVHITAGLQQKVAANLIFSADYVARRFMHFGGFHERFSTRPKPV